MRDDDVFAFVRVVVNGDRVQVGQVVYATLEALKDAQGALVTGQRKAVSAGSELAVSWPAWTPSVAGVVESVTSAEIVIRKVDGRVQRYRNHLRWPAWHLHRKVGDAFGAGDMLVSSVAPAVVDCYGGGWDWVSDLSSDRADDRFVGGKGRPLAESGRG